MKIGIFGGSFDPPTVGHFNVCKEILRYNLVDKIIVVPCGRRLDKQSSTPEDRLLMTRLAFDERNHSNLPIEVSDIEIQNGNSIPTYFLMKKLEKLYPEAELHFIIGSDLLPSLHKWNNGEAMIKQFHFIILERDGYRFSHIENSYEGVIHKTIVYFDNHAIGNYSSTEVRKLMKELRSLGETHPHLSQVRGQLGGIITTAVLDFALENNMFSS